MIPDARDVRSRERRHQKHPGARATSASRAALRQAMHDAAARAGTLRRHMSEELDFDPIAEARRQWDEHWGQDAGPSMVAVASIMRAYQVLLNRLNELLAPWELTFPQYEAWMLLFSADADRCLWGRWGPG
jgi:hypothetical protein